MASDYFSTECLNSQLKDLAVRGAGATVASRIVTYSIQIIGTVILARLLTPDDFGLVAMVAVFSMILVEFGTLRLTEATIQQENITHTQISSLFWINVVLCGLLMILFISLSPLIARFYHEERLVWISCAMAISFPFFGLSTQHLALLQRKMEFSRVAAIQIGATTLADTGAILLAWQDWGYWALVARRVTFPVATAIGAWVLCTWRPGVPALDPRISPMVKFGVNNLGGYTMNYFNRSVDKVLVGWAYGAQALGYYEKAYHLFVLPTNQLSSPLTGVAVATLSRLKNDPERYRRYYFKSLSLIAFVGMAIGMILTLIGHDLVLLLLGAQWDTAGRIFSFFGPGIGLMLINGTAGWLHLSLGRADRLFRWNVLAFIVTGLLFLAGSYMGPVGVAAAYSLSFYVLSGPALLYAGRPIDITFKHIMSVVWKPFGAALGSALLWWAVIYLFDSTGQTFSDHHILVRIFLSSIFCLSAYLMISFMFRGLQPLYDITVLLHEMFPGKRLGNLQRHVPFTQNVWKRMKKMSSAVLWRLQDMNERKTP